WMATKKRHKSRTIAAPPRRRTARLAEAEALVSRKQWAEARDLLEEAVRQQPADADALAVLANVYLDLRDLVGYQRICEQLVRLWPDDPDVTLGLAGAYL